MDSGVHMHLAVTKLQDVPRDAQSGRPKPTGSVTRFDRRARLAASEG